MNKQKRIIKSIFLYCLFLFFLVISTHLIKDIFHDKNQIVKIWLYLLISIFVLQIIFIIYLVFQDRDRYIKIFWIIFTSFFPIYGHLIFIFFGKRYSNSQKIKDYFKNPLFEYEKIKSKSHQNNLLDFYSLTINRGTYAGEVKLYTMPFDGFDALFEDIKSAKKS
ncbi:MAG: hypothetical protein E7Y34_02035, partial [Mycoplasma sp.]|nr:hypothetical protein [Mycoplasma sp.]